MDNEGQITGSAANLVNETGISSELEPRTLSEDSRLHVAVHSDSGPDSAYSTEFETVEDISSTTASDNEMCETEIVELNTHRGIPSHRYLNVDVRRPETPSVTPADHSEIDVFAITTDSGTPRGAASEPGHSHLQSVIDVQVSAPDPPRGRKRMLSVIASLVMLLSSALTSFGDRMTQFLFPVMLALAYPEAGLTLPAAHTICQQAATFLLGPSIGRFIDTTPRLVAVPLAIFIENSATALAMVCIVASLLMDLKTWSLEMWVITTPLLVLAFISQAASATSTIAVQRDWAIEVCGRGTPLMVKVNAWDTSISQLMAVTAPALAGVLLVWLDPWVVTAFAAGWNVVSGFVELGLLLVVAALVPHLRRRPTEPRQKPSLRRRVARAVAGVLESTRLWANDRVFLLSLAYSLLYFSILSPQGTIITVYLIDRGVSTPVVAVFRVFASVAGMAVTVISPWLLKLFGSKLSGTTAITSQITLLSVGVALLVASVLVDSAVARAVLLTIFLLTVVASRLGLWLFDIAHLVMIQTSVDAGTRGAIGGVEGSACSLMSISILFIGMVLTDPAYVPFIALLSLAAVILAGFVYGLWLLTAGRAEPADEV
ncbi:Ferroporti-1 [Carpediemonas membranifera]|uniref:Solute carrier family 40 member n=1 Tax=Carpediemonas membranifera TaxID=201153 RepID=A0A8J6BCZ6_9EUKA|nr:Ferroporti-1 [Carpediemonas membranifera]|eukprot:KAG9394887.1 Ferroporti-1 [Carpediemonas membranifera]